MTFFLHCFHIYYKVTCLFTRHCTLSFHLPAYYSISIMTDAANHNKTKKRKSTLATKSDSEKEDHHEKSKKRRSADRQNETYAKKIKLEIPPPESSAALNFAEKIHKQRLDFCESVDKFKFNKRRVKVLTETEEFHDSSKGVLYWMSRDQRVQDNWAFLYAQRLALKLELPLFICFCLVPKFLDATIRQFGFMLTGLAEVEKECFDLNIPFYLLMGEAKEVIPAFLKEHNIGGIVTDFSPLRTPRNWVKELVSILPKEIPFCQVDAHNIVPCWEASNKLEYGARTIRPKIHKVLDQYLTEFPPVIRHPFSPPKIPEPIDWDVARNFLQVNREVQEVNWAKPGTAAAYATLESFCSDRLKFFSSERNDPNKPALSNLSPWLHFGQISAQRCILTVKNWKPRHNESVSAFIEEAVVRRELSDNFCFYNDHYDSLEGTNKWARETLELHSTDKRQYLYSRQQLEQASTHDDLWNAAQIQMVHDGKMHGFLRMYWAKKILEWTASPQEALKEAIYLNDKYNLDGRDPNGYVGCMWSVCGIHDQGWQERPIFGKIRYMNYDGCKRKFDVRAFVAKYPKERKKN